MAEPAEPAESLARYPLELFICLYASSSLTLSAQYILALFSFSPATSKSSTKIEQDVVL